jgi:hypothetical protein
MIDKLNEMWAALAAYQNKADADGHGWSWALMCSEKTKAAADTIEYYAQLSINNITRAKRNVMTEGDRAGLWAVVGILLVGAAFYFTCISLVFSFIKETF